MENDEFDTYLQQIRRTPLFTREQEAAAVQNLEETRRHLRRTLLGTTHVLHGAIALVEKVAAGEARLERVIELDVRDLPKKQRLSKTLPSTWSRICDTHDASARDFHDWLQHPEQRSKLRLHVQRRRELIELVEQQEIRLERLQELGREIMQMPDQMAVRQQMEFPCLCLGRATPTGLLRFRRKIVKSANSYLKAKNALVAANLPLVVSLVKRHRVNGQDTQDLVQEGNLGLMRAVEKFRSSFQGRFSTYAVWWIRQALLKSTQQNRLVRLSQDAAVKGRAVEKCRQSLSHQIGREPTFAQVAAELRVDEQTVEQISAWLGPMQHVEVRTGLEPTFGHLAYDDPRDWYERVRFGQLRQHLREGMTALDHRECLVIGMRYGLDGNLKQTLVEIAGVLGISRSRVSQIQQAALKKLRNRMGAATEMLPL